MYGLYLPPDVKVLKGILEIFMEQSHKIISVPPAVLIEKVVMKISRKFLEDHSQQSAY